LLRTVLQQARPVQQPDGCDVSFVGCNGAVIPANKNGDGGALTRAEWLLEDLGVTELGVVAKSSRKSTLSRKDNDTRMLRNRTVAQQFDPAPHINGLRFA